MRRLILGCLVSLVPLSIAATPASAETLKPWWQMSVSSRPSSLQAGAVQDEVQEITVAPNNVLFVLEINKKEVMGGEFESAPYLVGAFPHATAANVQAALESESAYGPGGVVVSGQGPEGLPPLVVRTAAPLAPVEIGGMFPGASATTRVVTQARVDGEMVLVASNLGTGSVEGEVEPVRIADTLPPGLEAVGIEGVAGGNQASEGPPVHCSNASVSCTLEAALPPYETIEVRVYVRVKPGASSGEVDAATVSGGRAGTASGSQRLAFGSEPVFGVQGYEMTPEEAGGAVDTQAGSHPFQLTETMNLDQTGEAEPVAPAKDLHFKVPPGLIGNPTPFPRCTIAQFLTIRHNIGGNECRPETAIGIARVSYKLNKNDLHIVDSPLFNLEPENGEPARFGFYAEIVPVVLDTAVRTGGDYGVTVSSNDITQVAGFISSQVTFWGVPGDPRHDNVRGWECMFATQGILGGTASHTCQPQEQKIPPPLLSLPTSCPTNPSTRAPEPLQSSVEADSWFRPGGFQSFGLTAPMPALGGCNRLPFSPSISVAPDLEAGSTPTGLTVGVHVPQDLVLNPTALAESNVKEMTVALPAGVAINPAGADGLQSCGLGEIGLESPGEQSCPEAAKIATVEIKTPLLPNPLVGAFYLAAQNANPFGSLVAVYLVAHDPVSGVLIKLAGEVKPDPVTGQLVARFPNIPPLPFEDGVFHFFGGSRAPLGTPALCGSYTTTASIAPWSGSSPSEPSAEFKITSGPNGSPCSNPLPFTPSLAAGTTNIQAGGFTPFTMTVSREDGQQSIKTFQLHMPPGLSGLLSGVKLCGETEADAGTCGPESLIGETTVSVGEGGSPYSVKGGRVYITGPYEGAPFGVSVVVRAKAGPYDLGNVIVRGTIAVDPITAALTVTIDETGPYKIPTILDGIPLQIRHINFTTTRPGFTFNPTDCDAMSVTGSMSSTEGVTAALSVPFQATNCANLKFAPKFAVSTSGKTSRAKGASLSVKLTYPKAPFGSQANIARVKVDLPKQLPSRLTTLQKACTAAQFELNPANCPKESFIGHAKAITPLIPVPLEGPAIFVSHGGEAFPSLIVVLQGYGVTLDLVGTTFISKAGITSSTFKTVPDAPVGSFELTLPEGKFSALAANGNLCTSKLAMPTEFVAQNGAVIHTSTPISVSGCKPAITVVRHSVKGKTATIQVSVPSAGKLVATGKGLSKGTAKAGGAGTVTVKMTLSSNEQAFLAKHHGRRLKARITLTFIPKKGSRLKSTTTVLIS
jgi:hypothetical protein